MEDAAGSAQQRQTSPGVNWKADRGKLYRFWSGGQPGLGGVTVIRPWPAPAAWAKDDHHAGFHHALPRIDLLPSHPDEQYRQTARWRGAFEQPAWQRVPARVREAVCRAHLDGQQWRALSFQARVPGARRLADDVPLLAAMLSCGNRIRPQPVQRPLRSARALLRNGPGWATWRRIAAWLGLEGSRSMVRVLRKAGRADTSSGAWTLSAAQEIRTAWGHPPMRKLLLHLQRITPEVGELIGTCAAHGATRLLTLPLLDAAMEQDGRLRLGSHVYAVLEGARRFNDPTLLAPVRSIEELEARVLQALFAEEMGRRVPRMTAGPKPFPPPPLPPPRHGTPLDSEASLEQEGKEMRHCIGRGAYAHFARARTGYGYRLQHPDGHRATAWIDRDPRHPGVFRLQQLQGVGNGAPHPDLVTAVDAWIRHHRAWALHRAEGAPRPAGPPPPPLPEAWRTPPGSTSGAGFPFGGDDIPF